MNISKNTAILIGSLVSAGLLLGSGAFVVVPNIVAAVELQDNINSMGEVEAGKQQQLATLSQESANLTQIAAEADELIALIPAQARIDLTAEAVVAALDDGVSLVSLSRGATEAVSTPTAPTVSVTPAEPPFSVGEVPTSDQENVTGFSQIPLIIEITGFTPDTLATTLDNLALQSRLLRVASVNATFDTTSPTAQIYAYAFTNTSSTIDSWNSR